jgi:hypothetical protein
MSVSVPQPFNTTVNVAQPFRAKVEGVPTAFSIGVTELPLVSVAVEKIPTLHLSVDNIPPLHVSVDALPPIKVQLDPVEIRLTEIPSTRVHIPADFAVSLSMMGMDFGVVRLCGEAQVITEPYRPNPCEICSRAPTVDAGAGVRPSDPAVDVPPKDRGIVGRPVEAARGKSNRRK